MQNYERASREKPSNGSILGERPEPNLDEARIELAKHLSRSLQGIFNDRYGPLLESVNETAITELLRSLELRLARTKGDLTLVVEELLERLSASKSTVGHAASKYSSKRNKDDER